MRVFLTGATGLVGSHVAERLRDEGHDVMALVRAGSDTGFLESIGAELHVGDITEAESMTGAMAGCDGLVHSAAVVVGRVPWERYLELNVKATERVLEAAAAAGLRRAVHVSSVAVYGGAGVMRRAPVTEDTPLDLPLSDTEFYARSKRLAEEAAWRFQREGRLEVVVARPALVYGERDRVAVPRLVRALSFPVVPLVGGGRSRLPMVYAGNAASAIVRMLLSARAPGRAYNLATDFPITQRDIFHLFSKQLGRRPLFVWVPYKAMLSLAWMFERITQAVSNRPPFVNRRNVSFIGGGNPFDSSRAREELAWKPEVSHEEGVRRAVDWYLAS